MKLTAIAAAIAAVVAVATPALAEDKITELRVGLLGGENEADRLRSNDCLVQRYQDLLGVPVKLFPAADYAGVMEGLKGGTLDYAELGSSGYAGVYLDAPDAVEPIVTSEQLDGSIGYYSVMVTRADSGIDSLDKMKGKTLGFADPNSTSGFLVPSTFLPQQGYPLDTFFGETKFAGGHEQGVLAVLSGDVDGAVTWTSKVGEYDEGFSNGNLRKMVDNGLLDMSDIQLIWTSPTIPNGPTVLRKSLPQDVKDKLKASLLSFHEDDADCLAQVAGGPINRLVAKDHSNWEGVIEMRKKKLGK